MRRGEIWIAAGGGDFLGRPRPVLIVQSDAFVFADSVTACPITTDATEAPLIRVPLTPSVSNGLRQVSFVMVDKIQTLRRARLSGRTGSVLFETMLHVETALIAFLGIRVPGE